MQYKTIVLQILEQHPEIANPLRSQRLLLPTLDLLAKALKSRHEAWMDRLNQAKPGSSESQIASEALEFALKELENQFSCRGCRRTAAKAEFWRKQAFIRRHWPPG